MLLFRDLFAICYMEVKTMENGNYKSLFYFGKKLGYYLLGLKLLKLLELFYSDRYFISKRVEYYINVKNLIERDLKDKKVQVS